ncbi:TfpX/TfpZ family type IV pilin accessory protein [Dokdonella sp. MW10]|uniref:TfpX/TfpZ family type IV pilin accessory protein n=1 Tax=Dokdonella sp. MW10 TaxID=2992926 RepID=UPI003F7CE001
MSRWKAFAIHLSISAVVGLLALALLFGVWYPPPYFKAMGGADLTLILLGVDLVLGPLLTLVVFKSGKKSLRFDLSVIGLMQACALVYGLHVITVARPAFIVGAEGQFSVVAANDFSPEDFAKATRPEFKSPSWTGPRLVGARLPTDPKARAILDDAAFTGKDIDLFPQFFTDYDSVAGDMAAKAKPLADLRKTSADAAHQVDRWLAGEKRDEASVTWVHLRTRQTFMTMLLDARSGQPIDALPIDAN